MSGGGFRLEPDKRELERLQAALGKYPQECKKGMAAALNRTLSTTNTALQKAITQRYNIKKSELSGGKTFKSEGSNNLITLRKAKPQDLTSHIQLRGSRLTFNVKRSMVTPKQPKSHPGKTMKQIRRMAPPKVKVRKGGAVPYPHAFVAKGKGGVTALFSRDKDTEKLKIQHTLSIVNMTRNQEVRSQTLAAAQAALPKNVEREINYRLERVKQ